MIRFLAAVIPAAAVTVTRKEGNIMQGLVDFITGGAEVFTPAVLIGYMAFVEILACIGSVAGNALNVGR